MTTEERSTEERDAARHVRAVAVELRALADRLHFAARSLDEVARVLRGEAKR